MMISSNSSVRRVTYAKQPDAFTATVREFAAGVNCVNLRASCALAMRALGFELEERRGPERSGDAGFTPGSVPTDRVLVRLGGLRGPNASSGPTRRMTRSDVPHRAARAVPRSAFQPTDQT